MMQTANLANIWPTTRRRANVQRAEEAALRLLGDFDVQNPPVNPVAIARKMGVEVSFVSFEGNEANEVSGFYDYEERKIFVNRDEPALRQTFTVAHELGHQILHPDWVATDEYRVYRRTQIVDEHETEANTFAANLLMPRYMMDQFYELPVPDLSQIFAVSVPAIRTRLQYLYGF